MTSYSNPYRPTPKELLMALLCLVLLTGGAFVAAWLTQEQATFSLLPPGGTSADMQPGQRLDLHRTFFTVWAALILVTPALCLFPFRDSSAQAGRYWLAFWTVALLAFLVHFYWAVGVIFGYDWGRISHTARVSAPILDTVFTVWWVADVLLAWCYRHDAWWIRTQRVLVHLLAFVLFFMGAAKEGELVTSRALGIAMAVAVLLAVLARATQAMRRRQ
ncbi:MAG: hypothetical protein Q8O85_10505 [Rhodoferax sp.]|uniref:hypothetical protein n=1 Tax=Rhodoferax sp. TaxID=50421 RepID=UPI0027330341|nr:hypothetical protein [Rhodoferax sp.]MDP2679137.1 hypothetical protein [Rhodoferax sp.]